VQNINQLQAPTTITSVYNQKFKQYVQMNLKEYAINIGTILWQSYLQDGLYLTTIISSTKFHL
jgi:hypothetical protein